MRLAQGKKCIALLLAAGLLSGCAGAREPQPPVSLSALDNLAFMPPETGFFFSDLDMSEEPAEDAERIELSEGPLILSGGGEYVLSGYLSGQVILEGDEDSQFHLFLSDAQITSPHGPAIRALHSAKLVLTAMAGTENHLQGGELKWDAEPSAVVYSPGELTLNGEGSLFAEGTLGDGIRAGDAVRLRNLSLEVSAARDGIRGNNGVFAENCGLRVNAGLNGLLSETGSSIVLSAVSLELTAGTYGIWSGERLFGENVLCECSAAAGEYLERN